MRSGIIVLVITGFLLSTCGKAKGQPPIATAYRAIRYDKAYGLNEGEVNGFVFDSRGIGWVATGDGLYIYDGARFHKAAEYYPGMAKILNSSIRDVIYDAARNSLYLFVLSRTVTYIYLINLDQLSGQVTAGYPELVMVENERVYNLIFFLQNSLYYKTTTGIVKLTYLGRNRVQRIFGKAEINRIFVSGDHLYTINELTGNISRASFAGDTLNIISAVTLSLQDLARFLNGHETAAGTGKPALSFEVIRKVNQLMQQSAGVTGFSYNCNTIRGVSGNRYGELFVFTTLGIVKLTPANAYSIASLPLDHEIRGLWYDAQKEEGVVASPGGMLKFNLRTKETKLLNNITKGDYYTVQLKIADSLILFFGVYTDSVALAVNIRDFSSKVYRVSSDLCPSCGCNIEGRKEFLLAADSLHFARVEGDRIKADAKFFTDSSIVNGVAEHNGNVIMATAKGLYQFSLHNKKVERIRQDEFLCVVKTGNGWAAGTRNAGVLILSPEGVITDSLSANNGLPSNTVFSLLYDSTVNLLWIGSKQGLSAFHTRYRLLKNYTTDDGLAHNEFNRISTFQSPAGDIVMGGVRGISFIKPGITNLGLLLTTRPVILGMDILYPKDQHELMALPYNTEDDVFELQPRVLSAGLLLNGIGNEKLCYIAYRLDKNNWKYILANNVITFYSLSAGRHTIELKYAGADMKEGPVTTIHFLVKQVWYKKMWAILLFALLLAGIVYRILKWRIEIIEAQSLRELNRNRELMMSVIANDLRSPVGSYVGLAETGHYLAEKKEYKKLEQIIKELDENGKHLLLLIDNLLSWGLAKRNLLKYMPERVHPGHLLQGVLPLYRNLAASKGMTFYEKSVADMEVETDGRALSLILRNLLDNAIKYSRQNSTIELEVKAVAGKLEKIEVSGYYLPQLEADLNELHLVLDGKRHGDAEMKKNKLGMTMVRDFVDLLGGWLKLDIQHERYVITILFPVQGQ